MIMESFIHRQNQCLKTVMGTASIYALIVLIGHHKKETLKGMFV